MERLKHKIFIFIAICVIIVVVYLGTAFAYMAAKINGVESSSTIDVNSGVMNLTYSGDTASITGENIIPGWETTKKFTISGQNTMNPNDEVTDTNLYYRIAIVIDQNTFSYGSLIYNLDVDSTSSSVGKTTGNLEGTVPVEGTKYIGTGYFSYTESIVNHVYSLTISFPDRDINQGIDHGKSFAAHVIIDNDYKDNASAYITNLYESGVSYLKDDETIDHNIRYYGSGSTTGAVPNYIKFNNEYWRIIGVFNVLNTETGVSEPVLKIIRNSFLGTASTIGNISSTNYTSYSWDSSKSSINSGYGINSWNQADLMNELNSDYINPDLSANTTWYGAYNDNQGKTFNYTQRITSEYLPYIMSARWYLGGYNLTGVSANVFYESERFNYYAMLTVPGTTCTGTTCNDTVERVITWDGKVALANVSDFGYAATNNGTNNCSDNVNTSSFCSKTYNWMTKGGTELALNQYLTSSASTYIYCWVTSGYVTTTNASTAYGVRPVVYLKSNVKITGGNGTSSSPYTISMV